MDDVNLRDWFAAHAPADVPEWFVGNPLPRPQPPAEPPEHASPVLRAAIRDWKACDGEYSIAERMGDGALRSEIDAAEAYAERWRQHVIERQWVSDANKLRRLVQWRYAFADAMLAARKG